MARVLKTTVDCDLSFRDRHLCWSEGNSQKGLPLVLNSKGHPSWEITDFLIEKHLQQGGGPAISSLGTYARQLGRCLDFFDSRKPKPLLFNQVTNDTLYDMVEYFEDPVNSQNEKAPSNNHIRSIIQQFFKLLIWLRDTNRIPFGTVSTNDNKLGSVNLSIRTTVNPETGHKTTWLSHRCLPHREINANRKPITDEAINTLLGAIGEVDKGNKPVYSPFLQQRWIAFIEALEQTGGRIGEVLTITVESVEAARKEIDSGLEPKIIITTTKGKRAGEQRKIPVTDGLICELESFIEERNMQIEKAGCKDPDVVFITTGGTPLTEDRAGAFFREIRIKSGLVHAEAHPHLFRHRFINRHVKTRLKDLMAQTANYSVGLDAFVLKQVMALTFHASERSLLGYVSDALDEFDVFKQAEKRLDKLAKSEYELRTLKRLVGTAAANIKELKSDGAKLRLVEDLLETLALA